MPTPRPAAFAALAAVCLALPASAARADILHVPSQHPTIQGAIDAAVDGDEVVLAPGTYAEPINFAGKAITLRSTDPGDADVVAATILSGDEDIDDIESFVAAFLAGCG